MLDLYAFLYLIRYEKSYDPSGRWFRPLGLVSGIKALRDSREVTERVSLHQLAVEHRYL